MKDYITTPKKICFRIVRGPVMNINYGPVKILLGCSSSLLLKEVWHSFLKSIIHKVWVTAFPPFIRTKQANKNEILEYNKFFSSLLTPFDFRCASHEITTTKKSNSLDVLNLAIIQTNPFLHL